MICDKVIGSVDKKEGCHICKNYKHMIFTGYKTEEDALSIDCKSRPHVSGGVIYCPRCGRKL